MPRTLDVITGCTCTPGSADNGWHEQRCAPCLDQERAAWKTAADMSRAMALAIRHGGAGELSRFLGLHAVRPELRDLDVSALAAQYEQHLGWPTDVAEQVAALASTNEP